MVILAFRAPRTTESPVRGVRLENGAVRDIARLVEGTAKRFPEAKKPLRCDALDIWDDEVGL